MRTNIDSGITEKMADTTEGAAHTYLYCTDEVVTIFEYGDDHTDKPWGNFHYFDPTEGKITSTVKITGLESLNLKDYLRIHDFEANPDLALPRPRS
ncbi:MAG: hypothetical protein Q4C87_05335 [Actinomycetaceae bacterium]|nr:hypothetical protein [Actinomycetaceae bacterium]